MKTPLIIAIALVVIGGGLFFALNKKDTVTPESSTPATNEPTAEETASTPADEPASTEPTFTGVQIANNYYEYSTADYQTAKTAKRPVFLFFYANWCPTCAAQDPIVKKLMDEIADEENLKNIVAFRVNYNDNATSKDEEQLADDFGVRYQHTMFVLDGAGETVKKLLGQNDAAALRTAFTAAFE